MALSWVDGLWSASPSVHGYVLAHMV